MRSSLQRTFVLGWITCASVVSAQTTSLFLDDFGDQNVQDGAPGTWSGAADMLDASSGDLVIGAAYSRTTRLQELNGAQNVSIQTQLTFPSLSGNRDGIILFARSGGGSYWGELTSDGLMAYGAVQSNGSTAVWSIQQTQLNPAGGDVLLRFDVVGDQVSLAAWPAGTASPAAPQLSRQTDLFSGGGQLGVTFLPNIQGGAGSASVLLRYVFVHDGRANDADLLAMAIRENSTEDAFDLNNDGAVTHADRTHWIHEIQQTYFGDANLDGEFDSGDFVQVFQAGTYETTSEAIWSEGDWNGDGVFDSGDFVIAFEDGGYERGPRTDLAPVPEPSAASLVVLGVVALLGLGRNDRLRDGC